MIIDGLAEVILKRLNKLKEYAQDKKHDRLSIIGEIDKNINYICGDRSIQAHRMFFGYCQFLWSSYGDGMSFTEFLTTLKFDCGFVDNIKVNGEMITTPRSLSFSKCSKKDFERFFEHVKTWAGVTHGCMFEDWLEAEQV